MIGRVEQPSAPKIREFFAQLSEGGSPIQRVICVDSEITIQNELLAAFPESRVLFVDQPNGLDETPDVDIEPFLVTVDAEAFSLDSLWASAPWTRNCDILILRAGLGHYWSGAGDVCSLARRLADFGMHLYDVLQDGQVLSWSAPLSRIMLIFRKRRIGVGGDQDSNVPRLGRIRRAIAQLSWPIATATDLSRFAGRGAFGFAGGLLNPGVHFAGERRLLLARGEQRPWSLLKRNAAAFLQEVHPVLIELGADLEVLSAIECRISKPGEATTKFEDFRLFQYRGELYSNHAGLQVSSTGSKTASAFDAEDITSMVFISRVDAAAKELRLLGAAEIDLPTVAVEKNWSVFARAEELYCLYSFAPYRLLRLSDWSALRFEIASVQSKELDAKQLRGFRNSINPIEYDAAHWLHIVHRVYPVKQYAYWGVLIDKETLTPTFMTIRPLMAGWLSGHASILYLSSAVFSGSTLLLFGGVNDSSMGIWRIPRERLDAEWVPLGMALA